MAHGKGGYKDLAGAMQRPNERSAEHSFRVVCVIAGVWYIRGHNFCPVTPIFVILCLNVAAKCPLHPSQTYQEPILNISNRKLEITCCPSPSFRPSVRPSSSSYDLHRREGPPSRRHGRVARRRTTGLQARSSIPEGTGIFFDSFWP